MLFYGKSDVGKRRAVNQDDFVIKKCSDDVMFVVVCDGMGGAAGGNIASSLATAAFCEVMDEADKINPSFFGMTEEEITDLLISAVDAANERVFNKSGEDPTLEGMGTTLVGCLLTGEKLYVVNVGDSRLYAERDGVIEQISHDHSYVQYLVDIGKMTPEEAKEAKNKNIITRAVGTEKSVVADVFETTVKPGNHIVLCSDGLTNMVEDSEIAEKIALGDLQLACESLIDLANERGGLDNITSVILEA